MPADIASLDPMEEDDGWTHVKPKSHRGGSKARQLKHAKILSDLQRQQTQTNSLTSPEKIDSDYRRVRDLYEKERACEVLKRLVEEHCQSPINKAVCLGIGTFDPADGSWDAKRRTLVQLSAFNIIVEAIESKQSFKIDCIFQEPMFSTSDQSFLESRGHRVVESPDGFDLIDGKTLVFGIHLYRPIYAQALKSLPAAFVGTDFDTWDRVTLGHTDEVLTMENGQVMEKTYLKTRFPQDTSATAFTSTSIYFQPAPSKDEGLLKDASSVTADTELADELQARLVLCEPDSSAPMQKAEAASSSIVK